MIRWDCFNRIMVTLGACIFILGLAPVVLAGMPDPIFEEPPIIPVREYCETDGESARIGWVYDNLGDVIEIPVYIGSDDCVTGFRLRFDVPDEIDIDSAKGVSWLYGIDPLYVDGEGYLVVTKSNSVPDPLCMTPNYNDVFLILYGSTACREMQDVNMYVEWAPWNRYNPETKLVHTACDADTFEVVNSGRVHINGISIAFGMTNEVAMVNEEATVTVTCNNNYEFTSFNHAVTYNPAQLQYMGVQYLTRTAVGVSVTPTPGNILVSGADPDGYGTVSDGADFYQLVFKVINDEDGAYLPITFAATPREVYVYDADCAIPYDKPLHNFCPISYGTGIVTFPPYLAQFDVGDAVCLNDNGDEFGVPLFVKSNYPITDFSISLQYNDSPTASEFLRFENTFGIAAGKQTCTGTHSEYVVLTADGATALGPYANWECIGYLFFENSLVLPGQTWRDSLEFKECGCRPTPEICDDETWVRTWNDVWGMRQYGFYDDQVSFIGGWMLFTDPQVSVNIPNAYSARYWHKEGGQSWYTYDNWATTPFSVSSNVDLASLSFVVHWDSDDYCISAIELPYYVDVDIDEDVREATVTMLNLPASPYWTSHGKLRFENKTTDEVWGNLTISDIVAVEVTPSGDLQTYGTAGGLHLYASSLAYLPCDAVVAANSTVTKQGVVPQTFELAQNRPNPFNASTIIEFTLPEAAFTTLDVYNVLGQRVTTLMNDYTEAGPYSIFWNGRDERGNQVASGLYFYRLRSGNNTESKKMVLMK